MSEATGINIDALLDAPVAKLDTKYDNPPDGEYTMTVDTTDTKTWLGSGTRKDGSTFVTLNVPCVIMDEALRAKLGRQKLSSRMTIWLDVEDGKLASGKGKNVSLGQLREVLGQNEESDWNIRRLPGAGPFKGMVKNSTNEKDGKEYSNVTKVAKL